MCDCPLFQVSIKVINGGLDMLRIHGCDIAVIPFEFCPWCGKKLSDIKFSPDNDLTFCDLP